MKTLALIFGLLFASYTLVAQETTGVTITVAIDNVVNDEGKIIIGLHTEETFMRAPGLINMESTIENGKVSFTFEDVAEGTYAIIALHDANANNRMDYHSNGMPKEGYGMSRNEMVMGPPTFDVAKFEVGNEPLHFDIRL
ncbi:MAG: DUF2141 domain-containing protein [Croceitalea sp.]|nr:DUF2141 domain-containing protein [Croceitalea sp.]MBT8238500.1 DUF2141 domain-containing protein [Croceitalea sp.]NNC35302.1 DUF2141 domain-containing protein [Croceitalea sp.]NNL09742.1 DUF2141 domain-containing protein [Croceitalea sp.]NNM19500.1 DUF2141 domain-containing protein [Croceitalea sp.]